jgi:hypothetical protein
MTTPPPRDLAESDYTSVPLKIVGELVCVPKVEWARLQARVAELEGALKPFADESDRWWTAAVFQSVT